MPRPTTRPVEGMNRGACWVWPGTFRGQSGGTTPGTGLSDPCPTGPGNDCGGNRRVQWRFVPPDEIRDSFYTLGYVNDLGFPLAIDTSTDGLVVPVGKTIEIELEGRGWMEARADCKSVLEVVRWPGRTKTDDFYATKVRRYSVRGLKADPDTYLRAYNRWGKCLDWIRVSVKPFRHYALKFWYFQNGTKQGKPGSISRRPRHELDRLLMEANRYFLRQACVYFTDRNVGQSNAAITKSYQIGSATPGVVRIKDLTDPFTPDEVRKFVLPEILKDRDPSVAAHVVFVWGKSLEAISTNKNRSGHTFPTQPPVVMVQDEASGVDAKLLAHELGHVLTLGHDAACGYVNGHSPNPNDLMYTDVNPDPQSVRIRLNEANVMNP
jgi:hypothetical protein